MDNAQKLFEQLLDQEKEGVDRLIEDLSPEYLFMDFKCKHGNDGAEGLHDDDKKNFAKALSGFANSSGGVLIWGVDKKDKKKGVYKLIANPELFVESLNSVTASLAVPYVEGVLHQLLFNDGDGGVVLSYIPESDKAPHMAMRPRDEDKHYYKRVGDGFYSMPHFEIEDMFGRRNRPKLELSIYAIKAADSRPKVTYNIHIEILNAGKAISQNYGFDLEFPEGLIVNDHVVRSRAGFLRREVIDGKILLRYRNDHDSDIAPIYPGETHRLCPNNYRLGYIQFSVDVNDRVTLKDMLLNYTIYSENMRTIEGAILFNDLFVEEVEC